MTGAAGGRRRGRELAMKLLYQAEVGRCPLDEVCERFEEWRDAPPAPREFALELARGCGAHRDEIDAAIRESLHGWELGRLAAVDAQLLRVAVFELLFREDIPAGVTMDEAIELTREFSSSDAARFVNGVLDAVARKRAAHKLAK